MLINNGYIYLNRHTGDKKRVTIKPKQKAKPNVISDRRRANADDRQRAKRKKYVPDFKRTDTIGMLDQAALVMIFFNQSSMLGNALCL